MTSDDLPLQRECSNQIGRQMLQRDKKTNFTLPEAIAVTRCEIFFSHSPPYRECDKNLSGSFKRLLYAPSFPS